MHDEGKKKKVKDERLKDKGHGNVMWYTFYSNRTQRTIDCKAYILLRISPGHSKQSKQFIRQRTDLSSQPNYQDRSSTK